MSQIEQEKERDWKRERKKQGREEEAEYWIVVERNSETGTVVT